MTENLEGVLMNVNKFINIDGDRKPFMDHFEKLRNKLFGELKKNTVLKNLLNGYRLQGSYGDNVKVKVPDEYDFLFYLKLPENKHIIVKKDIDNPGFIKLDITDVLEKIKNQKQHSEINKFLKKWVSKENYLIVSKLQAWLESCFFKALEGLQNEIWINGQKSRLKYKKQGPAHTITVQGPHNYSVDFVPGILLAPNQAIVQRISCLWEAIPKPLRDDRVNGAELFRVSYYLDEYEIIKDKYTLKNALRMMKKFRDSHPNMNNLKSYFIKTLFLWRASKEGPHYWNKSLRIVVIDMFDDLEKCLCERKLPFYWDRQSNLLETLTVSQISEMRKCVEKTNSTLNSATGTLTPTKKKHIECIFLTEIERTQANKLNVHNGNNLESAATISATARSNTTTTIKNTTTPNSSCCIL